MLVTIPGVITAEQASSLRAAVASGPTDTSGAIASIVAALRGSPVFQGAALPAAMSTPTFHRYAIGEGEREHGDDAVIGQGRRLRPDIVGTLCLSDASSYDGGEMVIDYLGMIETWKGRAGDCLLYPADARQQALPVTRGERLAATFYVQSLVRDASNRKILCDFAEVLAQFRETGQEGPHTDLLRRAYTNLLRQWAEAAPMSTSAAG